MSIFIQIKKFVTRFAVMHALFAITAGMFVTGCIQDEKTESIDSLPKTDLKESLIKANQAFIEAERSAIEGYVKRHQLVMNESSTGLRYKIDASGSGERIKQGDLVELKYDIYLLDGTPCYNSDSSGTLKFNVEKSEAMNGFHEAVQMMRKGDKAILILPAHLAYGLSGDNAKIPLASALVCNIEVINVQVTNHINSKSDSH